MHVCTKIVLYTSTDLNLRSFLLSSQPHYTECKLNLCIVTVDCICFPIICSRKHELCIHWHGKCRL